MAANTRTTEQRRALVIGAGFSGLSAACCLAADGWEVTVVEKNEQTGGRCRTWEQDGFKFDMGPSWYWMPEVFEEFFAKFSRKPEDYYQLKRLDPPYKVFMPDEEIAVPDKMHDLEKLFETREPGAAARLRSFMAQAAYKYTVGMTDYVWRPSISITEFLDPRLLIETIRLQMFSSQRRHVQQHFNDETLVKLMEWPVLFLGGSPSNIPAMYSMMNHAAIVGGTWWPDGGMSAIPHGMATLAKELGVTFRMGAPVKRVIVESGRATGVSISGQEEDEILPADVVVAAADYHHVEQNLLEPRWRTHTERYWDKRVMSPGSVLWYLGLNRKVKNLEHHNLFFDEDIDDHVEEIYGPNPSWPRRPLFYASVTSLSDESMAPSGYENIFILVPLAPGLEDTDEARERCFDMVMDRLEKRTGEEPGSLRKAIVLKRSYAHRDFEQDYNSFKGNAYGLANTLLQTAYLKPSMKPGKVSNLYFAGQLTSPGPGVPPAIISGQVVAELIKADMNGRKRSFVRMMCILAVLSIILSIAAPRFLASFLEKAIQAEG